MSDQQSDLMHDEVPVEGEKYVKGDYKKICTHNDKEIKGFFGEYRFLSNFEPCTLPEGYPTVENAYMAAKVVRDFRPVFLGLSAKDSKKHWKRLPLVDHSAAEWDARKFAVMYNYVFQKFLFNIELRKKLMATGTRYLEETNWWGDTYYGVDIRKGGQNVLGKILMAIRDMWLNNPDLDKLPITFKPATTDNDTSTS